MPGSHGFGAVGREGGRADRDVCRLDCQDAALVHRAPRVERQIEQDLAELVGIGLDHAHAGRQAEHELRAVTQHLPQRRLQGPHEIVELHHPGLENLPPAEGQELLGEGRGTLGRHTDVVEVLAAAVVRQAAPEELRRAQHDRHLVVRLVSHSAGQPPHRLQPLRQPRSLLRDPLLFDVGERADPLPDGAIGAGHRGGP